MRRPSFQFYAGDWQGNAKLRRCTHQEKGVWMDVLCLMHDSEEYGVLRWPLKDIAQAVGCKVTDLHSINRKGVLKGSDARMGAPFIFTPRHAGKDGESVTLLPAQDGPIWFSSRMVRDEYIRSKRGESSRFDSPKDEPKATPKPPIGEDIGGGQGDGPSSSSSSSIYSEAKASGAAAPPVDMDKRLWDIGIDILMKAGFQQKQARSILGKHYKADKEKLAGLVSYMALHPPIDPVQYLEKAMQPETQGARW